MVFRKTEILLCCSVLALFQANAATAQEMNWSVETGVGYETNIYHAPDHDYIDTALPSTRPGGIAVSPTEISSMFIPVDVSAGIKNKIYDNAGFIAEIDFDTDLILSSEAEDAARTNVNLDVGVDYELIDWKFSKKKKDHIRKKRGNAYIGAFISTHDQIYVDRDTGVPKTTFTGNVDISDKYSFQSIGVKGDYERKVGKIRYLIGFTFEDLNYEKPLSGAEYDHEYQKLELGLRRKFYKSSDMKLIYAYSHRDYSDRHARDLATGTYSSANELLEYTYNTVKLSVGHKFKNGLKTNLDIKSVAREDGFEAYNDYSKLEYAIRVRYKYSDKTKIRAKLKKFDIDYDNAYNFEDVSRGEKESSGTDLSFKVVHNMNKNKSYYIELDLVDRKSTDDRYDYTNNMVLIGAKWEY